MKSWGNLLKPCITPWPQMIQWRSGRGSKPTRNESHIGSRNIYKLFETVNMLWMDIGIHRYTITSTLIEQEIQDSGSVLNPASHLGLKWYNGDVIEALNPHEMHLI
jgi:hypothetical protein